MASPILERKTIEFAKKLKDGRKYPAVIIGAEYSQNKAIAKSGPIKPSDLVSNLRSQLLKIGNLYEKINGYSIGCCAEVNAANSILVKKPFLKPNQILFSKGIRPRTMQTILPCKNCKQTFV